MKTKVLLLAMATVMMFCGTSLAAISGDVTGNGKVELSDAVAALQTVAGIRTGSAGLKDAIAALSVLAGMERISGQAVLGPLAGADVKVFRLRNLNAAVCTTQTDANGNFDAAIPVGLNEFLLIAVSGGQDTDANDDGVPDATPTPNLGTIYALALPDTLRAGRFKVSAITDLAWRFTKNLVNQADSSWIAVRLDDLAKIFIKEDISGDGVIDAKDLTAFMPSDSGHKSKLNFDFQNLFTPNTDGNSVIDCYHRNLPDVLPGLLDARFGAVVSQTPAPDTRYRKVRLEVGVFGKGSVKSDISGIDMDSARQNPADNRTVAFFDQSADGKVILTAATDSTRQIQSWNGCDAVSEDKTRCECSLKSDRLVTLAFGYKETKLVQGVALVNLSNAAVTVSADMITLNVTANPGDTDMAAALAALKSGDIVVGSADGGFLRKVVSVQKVSDVNYILTTDDAGIGDVIAQGSGGFYRQMTHGDLAPDAYSVRSSADSAVRLLPSSDPNDRVFRLVIGNPGNTRENIEGSLELKTSEGVVIGTLKGTVDITIDVECDASVDWFTVEYLKFIPKITATEAVELTLGAKIEADSDKPLWQKELHTFKFAKIPFQIGPLPVWIEPAVTVSVGLDGKISAGITFGVKFSQSARAGFVYNRGKSSDFFERFDGVSGFDSSYEPILPKITAIYGELKPYIKVTPAFRLYSVTGPAVALKGFVKVAASEEAVLSKTCQDGDGITAAVYAGLDVKFKWEIEKKIAKLIGNDVVGKLEFKIFDKEWLFWRKNFFGICSAPHMEVTGMDIRESVSLNSGQILSRTYTVKNTGQTDMDWDVTWLYDGVIDVSPSSGKLLQNQSVPVTVSVNTGKISRIGDYHNRLRFNNNYDTAVWGEAPTGSTSRNVTVSMVRTDIAAPVMAVPQSAVTISGKVIPTIVNLSWTYPDVSRIGDIAGYLIYMAKDPAGPWQKIATVAGNSCQIPNLQPETTYYFMMYAYGYNLISSASDTVSIKTPAVQNPTGADYTNGLGMAFKLIPAGTFTMGSPTDEPGRDSDETQHSVTLTKSFYMQTTEVTQGQWKAVMGSNPSYFSSCGDNCPVEQVSWDDIAGPGGFIEKMNQRGEGMYRLPTEAEWEYAARGGTTTAFYNGAITNLGDDPVDPNLDLIGWYWGNATVAYTPNDLGKGPHPVAQKLANAYGLYDMSGNVWEWCQDWYGSYPTTAVTDPTDPTTGSNRVNRGGSWISVAQRCRSASRNYADPSYRCDNVGFRLVLSPQVSR